MQYRGYTYAPEIDDDGDVRKIFHEIMRPNGSTVEWNQLPREFINISPYQYATREQFESAVDHVVFQDFACYKPERG